MERNGELVKGKGYINDDITNNAISFIKSSDDFGTQGNRPINPKLLDWLAVTYKDYDKWDTKSFIKRIVMSWYDNSK